MDRTHSSEHGHRRCPDCDILVLSPDEEICPNCGSDTGRSHSRVRTDGSVQVGTAEGSTLAHNQQTEEQQISGPLVPPESDISPDVSFVFPTRNEEAGIPTCITWAVDALRELGLTGEIIVSDSSTDQTAEIAEQMGAITVSPDRLGYGYAYRYGFEFTRGDYIVMGDADCTYDFRELPSLLRPVMDGEADLVLGSRFEGEILPGAMPVLHQYVGNPLLTKFLNVFYRAGVTDAHSGFRVFRRETLEELHLRSDGMEFASEMIMEAAAKDFDIHEVPITYRERRGEETLDSFRDGWRHVKFMVTNAPAYLFAVPGILIAMLGVILMALSTFDIQPGPVTFGSHTMILGSLSLLVGVRVWMLAPFTSIATNPIQSVEDPITRWIKSNFRLVHGAGIGFVLIVAGTVYGSFLLYRWVASGYSELPFVPQDMLAFTSIVLGVEFLFSSFHLSALAEA